MKPSGVPAPALGQVGGQHAEHPLPRADDADWATRDDARTAVFEFIEVWYNRERLHSSLGYLSPVAYELQLEAQHELAKAA